jgi:CDK inhibitor PHO81
MKQIINSLAKGRPADAALLAAGYRPPFHLSSSASWNVDNETASELSAAANLSGQSNGPSLLPESGESALLQAHKAAFFFKLERELEKASIYLSQVQLTEDLSLHVSFRSMPSICKRRQR